MRGDIFHVVLLGIDEQFEGKGISTELVEHSIQFAKQLGYKRVVASCTNKRSCHIFTQKLNFATIDSIDYKDWEHSELISTVLPKVCPDEKCVLVEKIIRSENKV